MFRLFSLYILLTGTPLAFAESEALKITGSLDMHYVYNFNEPRQVAAPTDTALTMPAGNNRYRIFDLYHDSLNLALAELSLSKKVGDTTGVIQLGFGTSADVLSPRDEVSKHLIQAYVTYAPSAYPRFSISAGKMLTHMGLEVAKTKDNWNYSRSILFGFGIPLWHTGIAARYDVVPEKLKGGLFLYNETVGLYEIGRGKTYGGQLHYLGLTDASIIYNILHGSEISSDGVTHMRTVHELIPSYQITPSLTVNADVLFGVLSRARAQASREAEWFAWSAGLKWQLSETMYISPRYEMYFDRSGATIETSTSTKPALPQKISGGTVTLGWMVQEGLEIRVEVRQDRSSSGSFPKTDGTLRTSQSTATAGLLFDF